MQRLIYILVAVLFSFPLNAGSRNISITKTGARPGLTRNNAPAIQRAIDKVSQAGGGTVTVPAGDFLTGPVELKSGVELHLEMGARLMGVADIEAYRDTRPVIDGKKSEFAGVVFAVSQKDIAITGPGTIDGQGGAPAFRTKEDPGGRPMILFFVDCRNVLVSDIRLENSAHWTQRYLDCEGVRVSGVKVRSHCNYNNDGIDIDSKDVVVSNCIFDCEDDAICLKSNSDRFCENITVSNCIAASNCNAIKLGTASVTGFRNISISNISIRHASEDNIRHWSTKVSGITAPITVISGIALEMVDGGIAENISISNVTMSDVQTAIFIRMARRNGSRFPGGSRMNGITINGVTASCESMMTSSITGVPGLYPENISISDADITMPGGGTAEMAGIPVPEAEKSYPENRMLGHSLPAGGMYIRHARNVKLTNVNFHFRSPDARPLIVQDDCENVVVR